MNHNLERYSDKVWQGGRKFGREQAIDDVLEIIDSYKYGSCWSATEKVWNDRMDEIKTAVLDLKGELE